MKKAGQLGLHLALFALLLLVCSALVEGPVPPQLPQDAPPPVSAMLRQLDLLGAGAAAAADAAETPVRRFFRPVKEAEDNAACVQVSDGNGYPLTGRTYVRTVYTACPLEDMPG